VQSLFQLLPAAIFSPCVRKDIPWVIGCLAIEDVPRFGWRGAMLDCARYFMPKEFVMKFIDLLALHKLNIFHWHLTDDQGWRIEIKKYPELTRVGAWRRESPIGHVESAAGGDGKAHGGFYSQEDIREIVAYAASRQVTIVPEIDMPGHMCAAIASYPQLGCTSQKVEVSTHWGVHEVLLNPSEFTIEFMQDVLTEVLELFPGDYIHIGGDEAVKTEWDGSAAIQERMKEVGVKDSQEMQSYFIRQMNGFLTSKGRRLIGWDEILEGGLPPGATVMSWRDEAYGITAAKAGHGVVMAFHKTTYLNYYQSRNIAHEPLAIGESLHLNFLPLKKVYNYNPVPPELTPAESRHILGMQGQLWTEYMSAPRTVEYMAFPSLAAVAEAVWTPLAGKNYANFKARLRTHLKRLDHLDVRYRPPTS
jgi:hexosaminidase